MITRFIILYVLCVLTAIGLLGLMGTDVVPLWARWLIVIFSPIVLAGAIVYEVLTAILNVLFNCDL